MITEKQYQDAAAIIEQYHKQPSRPHIIKPTHPNEIGCSVKLSEFGRESLSRRFYNKQGTIIHFRQWVHYVNQGTVTVKWDDVKKPMAMDIGHVEPIK